MANANSSFEILTSAARTADVTSEQRNHSWRGIILIVDVTALSLTPIVTPNIRTKDEAGNFDNVLWTAAATITATGQFRYILYPGASGGNATEVDGIPLPLEWQLFMDHSDADSITYSVRGHYIV